MIEVADVFRRFGDDYLKVHGALMLPSHRRAITDLMACRTEALGGHLWRCTECSAEVHSYHSSKNRSCPKCHANDIAAWLEARKAEMLPTRHFHVTVTVPEELRRVMRANQVIGYGLLMTSVTRAILDLARDPRYVGGTVGVLAVLHTWTRHLEFHPHVHLPGHRRRRFPGRRPVVPGQARLPVPGQGPRQAGARQAACRFDQGRSCRRRAQIRLDQALGRPLYPLG